MPVLVFALALALASAAVLPGCGGAGATLTGRTLRTPETAYTIGELGADWRRIQVDEHNDLAFAHEGLDAGIQANSSCDPALDIPLVALTNHLLAGFTERAIREQTLVPLDAREAMRTHVVAKLDGVVRELVLVVLKKDGCVYDLALVAPPGERFTQAMGSWDAFLGPFHAERGTP